MYNLRKRLIAVSVASVFLGAGAIGGVAAQPRASAAEPVTLETLYDQLAEPGRDDWKRVEQEILRRWQQSGSDSMDLLLEQGNAALQGRDLETALGHFSALVDHAPEFAEAWNARATTFFLMGEYSLAIADVEHVLALNPQHFGALQGLAVMFEQMGQTDLALDALRAVHDIHPNQPDVQASIERLERVKGQVDL